MAATISVASLAEDAETPFLLPQEDTVDGAVDYNGHPAIRSKHGRWRSASFIIGVEVAERIAYYGITSNLITYLTGPLGQSTATAAANANAWGGFGSLFPIVGAIIADSFLGRYRTIVVSSFIYILGLGLLTLAAVLPFGCNNTTSDCGTQPFRTVFIYLSLYLVAIGQSGHKPCVQAFGADQFDGQDPDESKAKSSFFNWWYWCMCLGPLLVISVLNYIQDNVGWGIGFGIPCIIMTIALVLFLIGTPTYRYIVTGEEHSAFVRIGRVFAAAARNWHVKQSTIEVEEEAQGFIAFHGSEQFCSDDNNIACCKSEVEEAKAVLRLFPVWAASLVYAIVFSQSSTFFIKQGLTMDRSLGPNFSVPPASLQSFISLSVVLFIPIYDRILVPIARTLTGKPAGITMLQRIGMGMLISIVSMVIAAIVEKKRLNTAFEHGLIDLPDTTVPMSVWWLVPQYVLFGVSDVFTMVGLQEFFYDQVPTELRSVGLSLYLSVFGLGSLLSSLMVSVIDKSTGSNGQDSWFSNNLNRAHLDYFYSLLAGLSVIGLILFVYCSKSYIYNRKNAI
ncbi:protein NRT1/ PTR FAMILY 5.10-like isoform X2 [Amaranthus tricolor]|uniref:protein NRT1/ PTR FAMILY 5.10-like isoform X2 n=1 Tax=Amaranthus tricolor TaxID=29722 RepID=UPI00258CF1E9|nr:protein NRT1/ PTR FAMILY 5.10-like isoform X2 [Amaranthus tricolor]